MCFSKIEGIKGHIVDKHPSLGQLVFSIKGDLRENLEKVCMKTKVCDEMLVKFWKMDPILSGDIVENRGGDDQSRNVKRKKEVKVKIDKAD